VKWCPNQEKTAKGEEKIFKTEKEHRQRVQRGGMHPKKTIQMGVFLPMKEIP